MGKKWKKLWLYKHSAAAQKRGATATETVEVAPAEPVVAPAETVITEAVAEKAPTPRAAVREESGIPAKKTRKKSKKTTVK